MQEIQEIISSLKREGLGILITDHNVRETLGICDRGYVLTKGKILTHGQAHEIAHHEKVRETYLGEHFTL